MGYMAHHALIIYISGYVFDEHNRREINPPDIAAYRETLPEQFRALLIGPVPTAVNGDLVVAFLPDGSKEGWDTSHEGDRIRAELSAMFTFCYEDGSSPFNIVLTRFGGDDPELGYAIDPRKVAGPLR